MRHWLVLGASLGVLAAWALTPVGAAAPFPCNFGDFECSGHAWDGITSQRVPGMLNTETGSAITFATNQTNTRIGNFQWAIGNEHCTLTETTHVPINMGVGDARGGHQVPAGSASVSINMGHGVLTKAGWQAQVVAGHFSKRWTLNRPDFAARHLPTTVAWHLTGTISGTRATGTMQWSFAGPTENDCSPSSGSFTWHASMAG
jgi:hypothetical protein